MIPITTLARVKLIRETKKAYLIELEKDNNRWIPKDCCRLYTKNGTQCIDIQDWFYNKMMGDQP